MEMINDKTLFIGGDNYNGIYSINVNNYQVTSLIKNTNIVSISTIIKLYNGNILIGCQKEDKSNKEDISYSYSLVEYEYNNESKSLIKERENDKAHNNTITGIINFLIHNEIIEIVSCSLDNEVKLWI